MFLEWFEGPWTIIYDINNVQYYKHSSNVILLNINFIENGIENKSHLIFVYSLEESLLNKLNNFRDVEVIEITT